MNVKEFDDLHDAIEILKKKSLSDEEVYKMIATVAGIGGMRTMISKYLPKGQVIIGTGESLKDMCKNPPQITITPPTEQ